MGSPGVAVNDKGVNDAEYNALTSGWYRTIELTIDADKDLVTLYPLERCSQIGNVGASDGTVKYTEINDPTNVKTVIIASGAVSGLLPRIKQLNLSGTTGSFSAKLYMHKIKV